MIKKNRLTIKIFSLEERGIVPFSNLVTFSITIERRILQILAYIFVKVMTERTQNFL